MSRLTVFCDTTFPPDATARLRDGLRAHRLLTAAAPHTSNLEPSAGDPAIAQADVVFGQPDVQSALRAPRLRWIHLTSASYTRFDNDAFRAAARDKGLALSTSSTVYAQPCAEHALAMMLATARQLPECFADQPVRAWHAAERRQRSFSLRGQTVVLLGYGAIARHLVELFAPFEMRIIALRRSPSGDEPVEIVTETELPDALAQADHVVNVLPETTQTIAFVNAQRLAAMPRHAYLYNVGRGTTVDQDALVAALHQGAIAGTYLDVTDPEPLPPDHPLWSAPHCHLTPHAAGGRNTEFLALVEHFLDNLKRFEGGAPLVDRVA
jgi:phosphoglycerate dehydrogenase-like enzyme